MNKNKKKEREKEKNARNHDTTISMEFTFPNITGFNKSENQMALSMLDIITYKFVFNVSAPH